MLAWQVAAGEAAAAGHEFIEQGHFLIGICSLDKWLKGGVAAEPQAREAAFVERNAVQEVLCAFDLDSTRLRRTVRETLGRGKYQRTGKVIHRSEVCRAAFRRAEEPLGSQGLLNCLHLLAALMAEPGPIVAAILHDAGVRPTDLARAGGRSANGPGGCGPGAAPLAGAEAAARPTPTWITTVATSPRPPPRAASVPSLGGARSCSRSSRPWPGAARTTRCSWVRPAWARPPSWRRWPCGSSKARIRRS